MNLIRENKVFTIEQFNKWLKENINQIAEIANKFETNKEHLIYCIWWKDGHYSELRVNNCTF